MRVGVLVTAAASTSGASPVTPAGLRQRRAFQPVCRAVGGSQGHDAGFQAAGETGWASPAEAAQSQQPDAAVDAPPKRRGPGRPPGHPAWNKGVPHTKKHRERISLKLKQKWKDPEFKRSVSEAMLGKPAWNSGQSHDPETLRKMSEAKLGKRQPLATRKLISQANTGRSVSEEARAQVGKRFRGQPKSPEHRSKLAAMARRRHAATRVLRAVEAVYSAASARHSTAAAAAAAAGSGPCGTGSRGAAMSGSGGSGSSPPMGGAAGMSSSGGTTAAAAGRNMGAVHAAAYSMGLTGLSDGSGKRLSRTQILNTFKSELREYRTLQEELSTWTAAFCEKNHRKPNLVDVQRTGIPWLIEKFKQYVVLRDRLFSDTSVLRGKLQEATPDPEAMRNLNRAATAPSAAGSLVPINANGPIVTRTAVASRFSAVMDYKMKRQAAAEASALGTAQQPGASEQAAAARLMNSHAPPRVRMAMQAALEYRQRKAHETKAAADAAAADAACTPSNARTSSATPASRAVAATSSAGQSSSSNGRSRQSASGLPGGQAEQVQACAPLPPQASTGAPMPQPLTVPTLPCAEAEVMIPVMETVETCLPL